jgi:hypothetical protein
VLSLVINAARSSEESNLKNNENAEAENLSTLVNNAVSAESANRRCLQQLNENGSRFLKSIALIVHFVAYVFIAPSLAGMIETLCRGIWQEGIDFDSVTSLQVLLFGGFWGMVIAFPISMIAALLSWITLLKSHFSHICNLVILVGGMWLINWLNWGIYINFEIILYSFITAFALCLTHVEKKMMIHKP